MNNNQDKQKDTLPIIKSLSTKNNVHTKKVRIWYAKLFLFSLLICAFFGVISEFMLSHTNIFLALVLILCLVCVSMIFDMIGIAVAASDIKPFLDKNYANNKNVKIAINLIKNADKVNSICGDVVGDVCSILSGAGGAAICVILMSYNWGISSFITSIIISSLIASLNVLGKAIGKTYAMTNAHKIVLKVSKFLRLFVKFKIKK